MTGQYAIVATTGETLEYDRAERWARCIGLFDAIALARSDDYTNFKDKKSSWAGKIEWEEWFEVRNDMPYGKAWLPVRAAAIRGLATLAGPERASHMTLIQLAEFADVFMKIDEQIATVREDAISQLTWAAVPRCFVLYEELVGKA